MLAARLSEDSSARVLLVEAGPDDRNITELIVPFLGVKAFGTALDWSYETVPETRFKGLSGKFNRIRAGKVLGGTSSVNAMIHCRGAAEDFNRWARYTEDSSWDYRHVLSYFRRAEGAQGDLKSSSSLGETGPLSVSVGATVALPATFIAAAKQAGFAENPDYNGAKRLGVAHVQKNQQNGERISTARAYLRPALLRPNLDVAANTYVTRVIIERGKAVGVHLTQGSGVSTALTFTVLASREVILSAGAIGSPKLLMLSGVGVRTDLEALNIPVKADLPVGENFQDHIRQEINFKTNKNLGLSLSVLSDPSILQDYMSNESGPLTTAYGVEAIMMAAFNEEDKAKDWPQVMYEVNAMSSSSAQLTQVNYDNRTIQELAGRDNIAYGFQIFTTLARPESRGAVTLRSNNPFDKAAVTSNYVINNADIETLIESMDIVHRIASTPALQYIGAELSEDFPYFPCKQFQYNTTDFWRCQIKSRPISNNSPSGTCKMGPKGDKTAVLDPQLRVQNIENLRVVDASIMPWITSCHINAPTVMIAEKAADMIRGRSPLEPTDLESR